MATPRPPPPRDANTGESFKRQKLQAKLAQSDQRRRELLDQRGSVISTSITSAPVNSVSVSKSPVQSITSPWTVADVPMTEANVPTARNNIQVVKPAPEKLVINVIGDSNPSSASINVQSQKPLSSSQVGRGVKTITVESNVVVEERVENTTVQKQHSIEAPSSSNVTLAPNKRDERIAVADAEETLLDSPTHEAPVHPQISATNTAPKADEKLPQNLAPMFDPEEEEESKKTQAEINFEKEALGNMPLRKFVSTPCIPGKKYQCKIYRGKDTVEKQLYPHYELYLEDPKGQVFLMSARKRKKSKTSNYCIETVKVSSKKKEEIVGKVRSNWLGTEFTVYDDGYNPFKDGGPQSPQGSHVRKELAVVLFDPNILGFKGPRKMTVVIPRMLKSGEAITIQPMMEPDTMTERYKKGNLSDILVLHNKSPQWNEESQSYVLNFNGRVTVASVKNFQVVHDNDLDYIIMQFGRVNDDTFTLDFQYPLSPMQAFSIALTSFDAKLACE